VITICANCYYKLQKYVYDPIKRYVKEKYNISLFEDDHDITKHEVINRITAYIKAILKETNRPILRSKLVNKIYNETFIDRELIENVIEKLQETGELMEPKPGYLMLTV